MHYGRPFSKDSVLVPPDAYLAAGPIAGAKNDDGGEDDDGHEDVGAAIVAGVDASPVLEAAENVFDAMALAVERLVVGRLAVGFGEDE